LKNKVRERVEMKNVNYVFFVLSFVLSFIFISGNVFSKPHKVDGENYPAGRVPQEITNNDTSLGLIFFI